jgi:ankyrin repeat protein
MLTSLLLLAVQASADIFTAVASGDLQALTSELSSSSNVSALLTSTDSSGDSPLLAGCRVGASPAVMLALLRAGADPLAHSRGLTCLHLSLVAGSEDLALLLVPRLPLLYLQVPDPYYLSGAIHWAAEKGMSRVVDALLRYGGLHSFGV